MLEWILFENENISLIVWDIDKMKPLSATVVLSLFLLFFFFYSLRAFAVERRKLGVNK